MYPATRLILLALLIVGCRAKPRPDATAPRAATSAPTVIRYAKPLLDLTRGIGGLPLVCSQLPVTAVGLQLALIEAQSQQMLLPGVPESYIRIEGDAYPSLRSMSVDVTGAQIRPDFRPGEFKSPTLTDRVLNIASFEYRAWPVKFAAAQGYLHIHAQDVSMALLQENGHSCLVITDARDGELEIAFTLDDLRDALRTVAKYHASKAGFTLRDLSIALHLESENQISMTMEVAGNWLILPGRLKLTGRLTLDDGFNAHVSGVDLRGMDLGGWAMARVVDSKLRQVNGRIVPLVRFPGNRVQLRDVKVKVDDKWRLNARFSRVGTLSMR